MEDIFLHKTPKERIAKMMWIVSKIKTCLILNFYSTNVYFDFYFRFIRINVLTYRLQRKTSYRTKLFISFDKLVTFCSCKDSFQQAFKMNFIFPADNLIPFFLTLQFLRRLNILLKLQKCNIIKCDNAIIFKHFYLKNLLYVMLEI